MVASRYDQLAAFNGELRERAMTSGVAVYTYPELLRIQSLGSLSACEADALDICLAIIDRNNIKDKA